MPDRLSDLLRSAALPPGHFLYAKPKPVYGSSRILDDDGNVIYDQRAADEYARVSGLDGMGIIDPVTHDIAPLTPPGMFIGALGRVGEEIAKDPWSLRSYANAAHAFQEMGGVDPMLHTSLASVGAAKKGSRALPLGAGMELNGENVLEIARRLNAGEGTSYGQWVKENPEAGGTLFDLANAQPAGVFPPGQIPRYEPARGVPDRIVEAFKNPRVRKQLNEWVSAGMEKMPDSWYRTRPLFDEFVKEWGPERAPIEMQKTLQDIAATSTSAKVPDNLKIASLYSYLEGQGLPVPDKPPAGEPSEWQEKMWVGAGPVTGLGSPGEPLLQTLARRIAYTAYQMGTTPDAVLRAYVRKEIPLLSLGAIGLGGGTLSSLLDSPPSDAGSQRGPE